MAGLIDAYLNCAFRLFDALFTNVFLSLAYLVTNCWCLGRSCYSTCSTVIVIDCERFQVVLAVDFSISCGVVRQESGVH